MRGVEFDAAYRIDRHFNLSLSGAYNDAIYKSYANAPAPIEYGSGILDLSGQRTGAPKWSGQASLNYEAPVTSNLNISARSEEHTSELQSLMRNSYAVFCLKKKKNKQP